MPVTIVCAVAEALEKMRKKLRTELVSRLKAATVNGPVAALDPALPLAVRARGRLVEMHVPEAQLWGRCIG